MYWAKIFIRVGLLYNQTRVFALKFWFSQSLNRKHMVNLTKATNLHTETGFVIWAAVRFVFEKIHVQLTFSRF